MAIDKVEWSQSERSTATYLAGNIRGWFSAIHASLTRATHHLFRSRESAPDVSFPLPNARQDTVVVDAIQNVNAGTKPAVSAANVPGAKADLITPITPDREEIERRRNLVRMLFNGYWSGVADKPAAFSERFDQAEEHLNERLAAEGEIWRIDAHTRVMLGLPPRSK